MSEMTREEAINELTEALMEINPNDLGREEILRWAVALDMAIEALEEQRQHGEWIPCSERLPKEHHKLYLVTKKTSDGGLFTTRSYFFSKEVGWSDEGLVAWMPMPEPYKEEGEVE